MPEPPLVFWIAIGFFFAREVFFLIGEYLKTRK